MEDKVTPFAVPAARHDPPADPGAAVLPFEQSEEYQKVLIAAHEHLLNAIEDERIDIDAWAPDTVARYVHTQTAAFVQEWRIPINEIEKDIVAAARDIDVAVAIDEDVLDARIFQERLQRAQAGELTAERLGHLAGLLLIDRHRMQADKTVELELHKLRNRRLGPAAKLRPQLLNAAEQVLIGMVLEIGKQLGMLQVLAGSGGGVGVVRGRHGGFQCPRRRWRRCCKGPTAPLRWPTRCGWCAASSWSASWPTAFT